MDEMRRKNVNNEKWELKSMNRKKTEEVTCNIERLKKV